MGSSGRASKHTPQDAEVGHGADTGKLDPPDDTTASDQSSWVKHQEKMDSIPSAVGTLADDSPSRVRLACLQVLLFVATVSAAGGYIGCFTTVQNSLPDNTYIWLGVEVILALLRIYIWGLNPLWDEQTGLSLELQLLADTDLAPTVTTAQDYRQRILGVNAYEQNIRGARNDPFVILTDRQFLEYISPYTGPVERFSDPDNHVAIYYALACCPEETRDGIILPGKKVLLTTVLELDSRSIFVLLHNLSSNDVSASGSDGVVPIYSATAETTQDSGIMTAKCVHRLHAKHEFGKTKRFAAIAEHSRGIADRIGGVHRVRCLRVSWGLDFLTAELEYSSDTSHSPLTHSDKEYLKLQLLASKWRHDFDVACDLRMLEFMASESESNTRDPDQPSLRTISVAMENLTQAECGVFEKYLFAKTKPPNHIFNEYARQLELERVVAVRQEALANRLVKYRSMVGSTQSQSLTDDIVTEVSVTMDIMNINGDDELSRLHNAILNNWGPTLTQTRLKLERKWAEARIATWRTCTSSNDGVAQAVFAAYPDAKCTNNPELFELMVARGCTVFDFAWKDTLQPPVSFDNIKDIPRTVSLLRCPNQWLPQLTELARSNPQIIAVETDDPDAIELQMLLQENMNAWGTKTHTSEWDGETSDFKFSFCFTGGFTATGDSMKLEDLIIGTGVLFVNTSEPGTFRVHIWHQSSWGDATLSWSHQLKPGDEAVSGRIKTTDSYDSLNPFRRGSDFRLNSFTVELPLKGVHRIFIKINSGGYCDYRMRKVWVHKLWDDSDTGDEMDSMLDGRSLGELYFSRGSSTSDILPVVYAPHRQT
ncbi:hypothetical protein B0H14DRAFT_1514198 [Mycena olivaceomarginata]|nr:hypothetical protein B0H14DRAFT_1514198 [Mycena olivaceomarginata]